jgi:hypothetical protein
MPTAMYPPMRFRTCRKTAPAHHLEGRFRARKRPQQRRFDRATEEDLIRAKSTRPLQPFYDFSITYTKAQRLTENGVADFHETRSPVRYGRGLGTE